MKTCKIKSISYKGKETTYNLTMASKQHNYAIFGQNKGKFVISRNSHAVAYTYISSKLLWLKAHYPLEFFAAIFSCEKQSEKLREYKVEAMNHGITIMPLDINKSGVRFQIVDDVIYFGFENIKGIGKEVSERIVANQPYTNFKDFLTRFGTDASVLKPLLGLRVFKDADPILLYKYYEWYKDIRKKREDSKKRFSKKCDDLLQALKDNLPESCQDLANFEKSSLDLFKERCKDDLNLVKEWKDDDGIEFNTVKMVELLHNKYNRAVGTFNSKRSNDPKEHPEEKFEPKYVKVNDDLVKLWSSVEDSQKAYYGFLWDHPLEKSPDYVGNMTFEDARNNKHNLEAWRRVEMLIVSVEKKTSQKGNTYWLLHGEDCNSEKAQIQVWEDDWVRWKDELAKGNLVKMDVRPPDGGFNRWTFYGPPRHQRHKLPSKDYDYRVFVMKKG